MEEKGGAQGLVRWLGWLLVFALLGGTGWLVSELRGQRAAIDALQLRVDALSRSRAEAIPDPQWRPPPGTAGTAGTASSAGAPPLPSVAPSAAPFDVPMGESRRWQATDGATGVRSAGDTLRELRTAPALRSALVDLLDSDDPEVQSRLQEAVRAQAEARRDEMRDARAARWEERTVSRISELAAKVQLDQPQQDALFAILARNRDRVGEAFRAAREDHAFGEARDKAATYRAEADAEARELLTDAQYRAYVEMRDAEDERSGFRRRPGPAADRASGSTGR